MASSIILVDGSQSFDGGIDSNKVTTLKDTFVPNGLDRNELAWLINARVRDGGITCRDGWYYRAAVSDGLSLYQGGYIYEPLGANPYLVALIGGYVFKVDLETYAVTNLTLANAAPVMSTTQPQAFFCQAENYLVIQDGSYSTLPLFWDGATLRQSLGITNTAVAPGTNGVNEIPAAGPMDYYMGRLWYVNGARQYSAGDIVGGASGTAGQGFKDAVLNVTENPLVVGGDGFTVPTSAGAIRALKHSANLNTSLGQGLLFIFTRKQIYSLDVPITRSDWISSTSTNQPVQKVVQFVNGAVSDRSIVAVNGDLFYQSLEPSIRSLLLAIRYYTQWGNTAISANEDRILQFNDRALLWASSGIVFNNRLLMTALPKQGTCGVYHQALIPLDFDPVSSFRHSDNPIWEGHYEGLDMMQLFVGDFGGHERAFTLSISRLNGAIQLWELTDSERFDTTTVEAKRITWVTETPAYTFGEAHKLKQLLGGEVWLDRAYGKVTVKVYYRVDADPCWLHWHTYEFCVAKSTCEDVINPVCYPITNYAEGYKWPIVFPKPPAPCDSMHVRPSNIGYQFQVKIEISGWGRIRSLFVYGTEVPRSIYQGLVCKNVSSFPATTPEVPVVEPTCNVVLVAYYKCDEASGPGLLVDSVGARNLDPTPSAIVSVAGKIGTAVVANRYINGPSSYWTRASSFTVRFWNYFTEADPFPNSRNMVSATSQWGIHRNSTGYRFQVIATDTLSKDIYLLGVTPNAWHHVVAWYNKETGRMGMKVDNSLSTDASVYPDVVTGGERYLAVGDVLGETVYHIDEIAIWDCALTDAQIAADYNSGVGNTYPNVIGV